MAEKVMSQNEEKVDLQQLAIWTTVAAVASAVINAILFVLTAGQFDGAIAMGNQMNVTNVIVASIVQIAVGGIVLAVLDRFVSKPISTWRIVAIVALVLSFAMPFTGLEGEYSSTAPFILIIMHIIAGAITIYLLTTRTQKTA